jgi:hypothetical protein
MKQGSMFSLNILFPPMLKNYTMLSYIFSMSGKICKKVLISKNGKTYSKTIKSCLVSLGTCLTDAYKQGSKEIH